MQNEDIRVKKTVFSWQICSCLIVLFLFSGVINQANGIEVAGMLQGGTWAANDTVRVMDDIILHADSTLSIEAGVYVEFTGPYQFTVSGVLTAVGELNNRIVFTTANPDPLADSLRWRGIRYVNAKRGCLLKFCRIEYGWARGAWPSNNGGGIYIESSTIEINRCEIMRNRADASGGGIYGWFTSSEVKNTVIAMNHANSFGGGMFVAYSSPKLNNCTVVFDTARAWGGGIFAGAEGKPAIRNSIIAYNVQELVGNLAPGDAYFKDLARARSSDPVVIFSCVRESGGEPFPGPGNFSADPKFRSTNPNSMDLHLSYSSPCIDAGDPAQASGDESDPIINVGAYGGTDEFTPSVPIFYSLHIAQNLVPDFGNKRTGAIDSYELKIENHGHSRLYIYDILFNPSEFPPDPTKIIFFPDSTDVDGVQSPAYLAAPIEPGEIMKFSINFQPDSTMEYETELTFVTNDTIQGDQKLKMKGKGIDPIAEIVPGVSFGTRKIGGKYDLIVYLKNAGRSNLHISSISMQGDGFGMSIEDEDVAAGDSTKVTITFRPDAPTAYEASATINTNDKNLLIILTGIGTGPRMEVLVDSVFIGYVYVGGEALEYPLPITNSGDSTLVINEARTLDAANYSAVLPDGGLRIEPDDTSYLSVRFHPQSADSSHTKLLIRSNYPVQDTVKVSGKGMPDPGLYIFGEVSGELTWDTADPVDYIVLYSVEVPVHEKLIVRPGTRILFEEDAFMEVNGELRALGTPDDRINFMPRTPEITWKGIELNLDDNTRLSYCFISGSLNGVSISESSPVLQFCTISENGISDDEEINGGGISLENSGAYILGCIIENNSAMLGGGIYVLNSKPNIQNCTIRGNSARVGGGIYLNFQAGAWMQSNLIVNNTAVESCGGLAIYNNSSPMIVNNTIVDNTNGGILAVNRCIPLMYNTIVWDNAGESIATEQASNILASYSNIQGTEVFPGRANLNTDPMFDNIESDYHLLDDSPLVDAGNPEPSHYDYFFPPSKKGVRNDIGAYGGPLGGGWTTPELGISIFQNPAFPQWIDIFVTSYEVPETVPACSLRVENNPIEKMELSTLNEYSYKSNYEAQGSGTIFITVDAVLENSQHQKIGRTFELSVLTPEFGGTIMLSGINGSIEVLPGSLQDETYVIAGVKQEIYQPRDNLLFMSRPFFVQGIEGELRIPALMKIELDGSGWADTELARIGIYRVSDNGIYRLESEYQNGMLSAEIVRGGSFILAWDENFIQDRSSIVPEKAELIRAYPNPFNQRVTLEFSLGIAGFTHLGIYDIAGRLVATLIDQDLNAGAHKTIWDGSGTGRQSLPSGIYWARLESADQLHSVKLLLLR